MTAAGGLMQVEHAVPARAPQLRFLVAEDHDFQRDELVRTLRNLGAGAIYEAADGHGALAILADVSRPVDIVISDLQMAGMDGIEFIRHLAESGTRISIIVASALERNLLASIATMSEAYGINLLGVVEKPLTPRKLAPLFRMFRDMPADAGHPPVAAPVAAESFSVAELVAGLKNDEFEPFFQPKIELASGQVKGVEALARWRHPRLGIVGPQAFVTLLEEHDLIDDLTRVMLAKAARCCSEWRAAGINATVSVNLSVKSLGDMQVADRIAALVRQHDLEPACMVLEVTESTATTHVGNTLENLARLRMKGFGLAIDDYGTGYSSMQQLARIAFTELKIDQSFVRNAAKQPATRVIFESSVIMARKLNMTSVAEGVETRADFDLLARLHCDMAQGYFIARPMPASELQDWIRAWNKRGAPPGF